MTVTRLPGCFYCGLVYPIREWEEGFIADEWVKLIAQASFLTCDPVMLICPSCTAKRNYRFDVILDPDDFLKKA